MNASKLVFSDDSDTFKVISVDPQQDILQIYVQSTMRSAPCPNCCISSKRIHSYYARKIADLPVFGKTSRIILRARKFYCNQDECPFKVFTGRFATHFKPNKRRTERLEGKIRQLGLLAGGRPAQRICGILSMPTSDTTILRLIEKIYFSPIEDVTAIGVDDRAYKKRKSYVSILVNLHTGKVIDLLPDREQETLRKWLQERPEIEVMGRDRYSNYQKAITCCAPQAI
ncbi:transposase family protein [Sphingobacterium siyangense]|uniref:transposase family protein n=1 Tax=Sphingobacterium siyangense TaxID=459529 RepID=UPI00196325C0|nr:transposase [Sphingobacterium siyangense]QRY58809.1 transposase [Sphingobacterium siyangense]